MDKGLQKGSYEFTQKENRALHLLSKELINLGIILLIAGLLFVTYIIVSFVDPPSLVAINETGNAILTAIDYSLWILISILIIFLSVMIIRLAGPIRLIADTVGLDISHLMEFVKSFTFMARISFISLVGVSALILVSLIIMILVF